MKLEVERTTENGERSIRLIAIDSAKNPGTLRAWIKMLQLAERWLKQGQQKK